MVHPASSLVGTTGEAVIRKCAALVGVHNYEGADLEEAVELLIELQRGREGAATTLPALPEGAWDRLFSPPFSLKDLPEAMALASKGVWARVVVKP